MRVDSSRMISRDLRTMCRAACSRSLRFSPAAGEDLVGVGRAAVDHRAVAVFVQRGPGIRSARCTDFLNTSSSHG